MDYDKNTVYFFDNDFIPECPQCGRRSDFRELENGLQLHTCLNRSCGFVFLVKVNSEMNTKIEYQYRDACNYKQFGEVTISGELSLDDLSPFFHENEFFVPLKVGLPDLQELPLTEDDHPFHVINECSPTDENPDCDITSEELLKRFREIRCDGWED